MSVRRFRSSFELVAFISAFTHFLPDSLAYRSFHLDLVEDGDGDTYCKAGQANADSNKLRDPRDR